MSSDGSVTLFFGDGDQRFRIGIGEFRELQEKVNKRRIEMGLGPVGPTTLANLLRANDAWPDDMRDVLRIGLVGGGMKPVDAHRMLVLYFDDKPPINFYLTAFTVLMAAFVGVEGDEVQVKKKTTPTDQTSPSSSPTYTATAPS
jgi:hypothetical protein